MLLNTDSGDLIACIVRHESDGCYLSRENYMYKMQSSVGCVYCPPCVVPERVIPIGTRLLVFPSRVECQPFEGRLGPAVRLGCASPREFGDEDIDMDSIQGGNDCAHGLIVRLNTPNTVDVQDGLLCVTVEVRSMHMISLVQAESFYISPIHLTVLDESSTDLFIRYVYFATRDD